MWNPSNDRWQPDFQQSWAIFWLIDIWKFEFIDPHVVSARKHNFGFRKFGKTTYFLFNCEAFRVLIDVCVQTWTYIFYYLYFSSWEMPGNFSLTASATLNVLLQCLDIALHVPILPENLIQKYRRNEILLAMKHLSTLFFLHSTSHSCHQMPKTTIADFAKKQQDSVIITLTASSKLSIQVSQLLLEQMEQL